MPRSRTSTGFRRPYIGSNSSAHRELWVATRGLLGGPLATPVELELRDKSGKVSTHKIARGGYTDVKQSAPFELRRLPGNVAYLAIKTFADESAQKELERLLPELRSTAGLLLDVRENVGGSAVYALNLIGYLMPQDFPTLRWRSREYIATLRVWGTPGGWYEQPKERATWKGHPEDFLPQPVVLSGGHSRASRSPRRGSELDSSGSKSTSGGLKPGPTGSTASAAGSKPLSGDSKFSSTGSNSNSSGSNSNSSGSN